MLPSQASILSWPIFRRSRSISSLALSPAQMNGVVGGLYSDPEYNILDDHSTLYCTVLYPVVGGGPDSSVLLQLPLYTLHPPNVHTSTTSTHILYTSHLPTLPLCPSRYFLFRPDSLHSTTATLLCVCVCVSST